MNREWRSEAWKATNSESYYDKIENVVRRLLMPIRKFIGRVSFVDQIKFVDVAAKWIAWHNIEGDYCEFGVYTGRQFTHAYKAITKFSQDTRFYAFDSFEGLPKPEGVDLVYPQFAQGAFSATRKEFMRNIKSHNVNLSRVDVVEGWYSDTLNDSLPEKIGLSNVAIVVVDCDLYSSTILALNFLTDLIVDGGIIIFDDWHLFRGHPDLGPQKAFNEWKSKVPEFQFSVMPPVSDSFQHAIIVHRPLP